MIQFSASIKKFGQQGEKTGWTYIDIPSALAEQLKPGHKKSFRVKGLLDHFPISGVALVPMGGGDFILALNAAFRKGIKKSLGATLQVRLEVDEKEIEPPAELMECLQDEPLALAQFRKLPKSHQHYFTRWINEAKTEGTRAKRIAQSVTALAAGKNYSETLRSLKKENTGPIG